MPRVSSSAGRLRLLMVLVVASLIAAACGGTDVSDSIVLPEGFTTTTVGEPEDAAEEFEAPEESAAVSTTSTTATPAVDPDETPTTVPPVTVDPDLVIAPALSESGRAPAYGGGNPTTSLTEALSITMPAVEDSVLFADEAVLGRYGDQIALITATIDTHELLPVLEATLANLEDS